MICACSATFFLGAWPYHGLFSLSVSSNSFHRFFPFCLSFESSQVLSISAYCCVVKLVILIYFHATLSLQAYNEHLLSTSCHCQCYLLIIFLHVVIVGPNIFSVTYCFIYLCAICLAVAFHFIVYSLNTNIDIHSWGRMKNFIHLFLN